MSAEVSGAAEGVTLLELLRSGEITHPGRMNMGRWNSWRSGPGRRPTQGRDGRSTTPAQEGVLLRQAMELLDDPEAADFVAAAPEPPPEPRPEIEVVVDGQGGVEEEEDEEELVPDTAEADGAGSAAYGQSPPSQEGGEPAGPGGRLGPQGGRAESVEEDGSEAGSGFVVGVESLSSQVKVYNPETESLMNYNQRVSRVAKALVNMGVEVSEWELDVLFAQASFIHEESMKSAGALSLDRPREAVERLKARWMGIINEPSSEANTVAMTALSELIEHFGGKISSSPGKAFSTPSTGPREVSRKDAAKSPPGNAPSPVGPEGVPEEARGRGRGGENVGGPSSYLTPPRVGGRGEAKAPPGAPPPFPSLSPEKTPVPQDSRVTEELRLELDRMRKRVEQAEARQAEAGRAQDERVRELERQVAQQDIDGRSNAAASDLGSQSEAISKALQEGIQAGLERGMAQQAAGWGGKMGEKQQ